MSGGGVPPPQRGTRHPAERAAAVAQWREAAQAAAVITEAAEACDARTELSVSLDVHQIQHALLVLTDAGHQLARTLDSLADYYDAPGVPEPTTVYVALEQAAAAAEDLGVCIRRAAQALDFRE